MGEGRIRPPPALVQQLHSVVNQPFTISAGNNSSVHLLFRISFSSLWRDHTMETDKKVTHIYFLDMESSSIKPELTVIYFQKIGEDCHYFSGSVLLI